MSSRKDNLKRTEETLRENEDKYKFLVDNSKEIILILNKRGKIIFANKSTLANYGYSEEELIGKSIAHFLTRDCIKKALYALAQEFLGHSFPEMDIQFKTKSGEIRYLRVAAGSTPVYDKGKLIGLMVNASDVTEPRKTEEKLRESEKRFRELWDHAPVAYHTLDSKGIITSVNQTEAKMLGYAKEEMVGKPILEFILPEQHAEAEKRFQQKISGDPTLKAANRVYVSKDGSKIYVMIDDVLERNKDGDVIGIRTTMVDMTKDKEAEEALKRSEEHFRDLVEKAGIAISIDDREGNLTYFNERYAEIFGYSVEEMKKQSVRSLVHSDDIELVMLYHQERLQDKKVPSRYEFKGVRKDGSVIYLEVDVVVLREAGRLIGTRSYMWDITDRKRAEEVLQKRNTQLELIHHVQSEIPMNTDIETILLRAAESIGKSFGYYKISVNLYDPATNEIEYLTGWNKTGLPIPRGHRQKLGQGLIGKAGLLKQTIVANDVSKEPDYMPFHLTETKAELIIPLIVQDRLIGVLDVQATQAGAFSNEDVSVLEAITNYIARIIDGKQKEEALRESEERFRSLFENAPIGIYRTAPDGRILEANPSLIQMLGYSSFKELVARNLESEGFEPDYPRSRFKELIERDGEIRGLERTWTKRDNSVIYVRENARAIRRDDGTILYYEGSVEDITERKRAEEELKNSEEMFKITFEYAPDALYLSDLKGNFVDGNKMAEKLTGYKREELIGKSFLKLKLLPLDHVPKAASLLAKNVMRKPTGPDEFVLKRKAGGDVWVEIRTYPVKIRGKTLALGIARDITERKKAEKALLESERKLRFLAESTRDVVFVYDMNRRLQYVNPAVEEFTGYSIQEIYEQNFINYLHPEDQERMMKLWEELFQGKSFSGEEFRIVTKDGKIKWCSSSWGPLLDEKGNQIGIQGRELDITKRKLAEETLQKNETKYRALFECANDAVFLLDSEGKHVIVNKKAADMLGYDIKELIGLSYRDIIAPSEYKDAKNKIQAILKGESFSLHERTFRKKDGTEFPVEINLATIRDAEGRPLYVQRIVRDITERKRAENELKQTSNKLRQALGSIVKVVALTVEQRDPYTAGHQNRVANLARAIAIEMDLSEDHIEGVYTAGIIHDIGKISAPAEILSKPSKLSEVEFSLIKEHAKIGYDILKEIEFPWPIAQIVYQHHERINGSGYPQGLSGEDILLEARILGVADAVEAMASHRPYRPAHGLKKALEEISKNRGILYDPGVVDACLKIFAKKKFKLDDKEMATSNTYEIKNPG